MTTHPHCGGKKYRILAESDNHKDNKILETETRIKEKYPNTMRGNRITTE